MKNTIILIIVIFAFGGCAPRNLYHFYPNYDKYLKNKDFATKNAFYFKADTKKKVVCLSFDDGPDLKHTSQLTSLLKEMQCPAVFFVVGKNFTPELESYYHDSLFEVQSHSFNHYNYKKMLDTCMMREDFMKSVNLHNRLNYGKLKYYRPPYGIINDTMVRIMYEYGLQGVLWSFDTMDFTNPPSKKVLKNINTYIRNGNIILMHEIIDLDLLKNIVVLLRKKGFKIVKLSELTTIANIIPTSTNTKKNK